MKRLIALSATLVGLLALPASAHHSLSPYVMSTYRTIDGTVKSFEFANPHARLALLVPGANGSSTLWDFEGGSIGRMMTGGFTKDTIRVGDKITVSYSPRRNNSIGGFFLAVRTEDGTTYAIDRFKQLKRTQPPS